MCASFAGWVGPPRDRVLRSPRSLVSFRTLSFLGYLTKDFHDNESQHRISYRSFCCAAGRRLLVHPAPDAGNPLGAHSGVGATDGRPHRFICGVTNLAGTSAEAKQKTVAVFYERLLAFEEELDRIQENLRLG